jgi:predicted RNA-binding protein with RPS1 domain
MSDKTAGNGAPEPSPSTITEESTPAVEETVAEAAPVEAAESDVAAESETAAPGDETVTGSEATPVTAEDAEKVDDDPAAEAAGETPTEQEVVDEAPAEKADHEPVAEASEVASAEKDAAAAGEKKPAARKPTPPPMPMSPTEERFRRAKKEHEVLEGKVIGWNKGGLHVVIEDVTAFCPRSEIELGEAQDPASYLDQELTFKVLKIQDRGRRIVVSRSAVLRNQRSKSIRKLKKKLDVGAVLQGTVASLTDFGAFVDLGGIKGLVHVSEISYEQVRKPEDVLEVGQEVEVKIIRLESDGRRISLSMKALGTDPWKDVAERYEEGTLVTGVVERTTRFGAFIQLEPGLTGLLPMSEMNLPREASAARVFPSGKEVKVQVVSVDRRRRRISLGLEGSNLEGSRSDYKAFKSSQKDTGFHPFAEALKNFRQ